MFLFGIIREGRIYDKSSEGFVSEQRLAPSNIWDTNKHIQNSFNQHKYSPLFTYRHFLYLTIDLDIQNAMFNLLITIYNFFVFPFGVLTFGNVKTTWWRRATGILTLWMQYFETNEYAKRSMHKCEEKTTWLEIAPSI